MLYLMRKPNESIIINNNIELKVIEVKGKTVKLGFTFPKGSSVLRKELYDKIMNENLAAAESGQLINTSLLGAIPKLTLGKKADSTDEDIDSLT